MNPQLRNICNWARRAATEELVAALTAPKADSVEGVLLSLWRCRAALAELWVRGEL